MKRNNVFLVLVLLLVIFIAPMIAAWSLYTSKTPWLEETVNFGTLIQPPLDLTKLKLTKPNGAPIKAQDLSEQWLIVLVSTTPCNDACEKNLYNMRQVWIALGKDMDRVQRLIITTSKKPDARLAKLIKGGYVGTLQATTTPKQLQKFFGATPATFYIVDPHSNVIMKYDGTVDPEELLKDLNRLLRVSQIG